MNIYLGSLCKRGHRHQGTSGSLRYIVNNSCVECARTGQAEKRRDHEYYKSLRDIKEARINQELKEARNITAINHHHVAQAIGPRLERITNRVLAEPEIYVSML